MIDLRRITLGAAAPVLAAACAVASRPGGGAVPGGGAIPAGSAASISASSPAGDAGEGAAGPICSDIAGCISIAERAYLAMDAAPPDAPERLEHGDRGARALRAACALGDPDGCYRLADAYALGRGVPPSAGCQIRFLRRACDLGSADGCVTLADVYQWNGGGIAAAPRLAVSLYETACAAGRMDACGKLAAMVQEGAGVPRDEARAAHLYEQVCEHGTASGNPTEIRACAPLARMLLEGRLVPKDEARAVSYLEAACEMGEFPACGEAALLYAFGRGVPREPTRAGALFDTACANGFGAWCKEAEALYRTGRGLPRDSARADHFLESSLAWLAYGCRAHGVMGDCEAVVKAYSTWKGRPPRPDRAVARVEDACALGVAEGCRLAAQEYAEGVWIPKDPPRARSLRDRAQALADETRVRSLLEQGCAQGRPLDCYLLGDALWRGKPEWGIDRDESRGRELLRAACAAGEEDGVECRVSGALNTRAAVAPSPDTRACDRW